MIQRKKSVPHASHLQCLANVPHTVEKQKETPGGQVLNENGLSLPIHCHPCDNHCKEVLKTRHPNFKAQSAVTDRSCTLYSLTFEIFCIFEWLAVPPFLPPLQVPKAVKMEKNRNQSASQSNYSV